MRAGKRIVTAALLFAVIATPVMAQRSASWQDQAYDYVVLDQDVRETLTDFGRNLGLPVSVTDAVRGRVSGQIRAQTARGFLDSLSQASGLVWYFDGSIIHVSADSEFQTRIIATPNSNAVSIVREINASDMADARFGLRAASDGSVITVSGPPGYTSMVEQFAATGNSAPRIDGDDPRVRVFRGNRPVEIATTSNSAGVPTDAVSRR